MHLLILCRPARPSDTDEVLQFTQTIWDGHDYVPAVWPEWLADPEGGLVVAEYGGRVVGSGKVTRLGPGEWWLEGLRVDPGVQGQGVGSALHDHLVNIWRTRLGGVLRFATSSKRQSVHHLAGRTGFERIDEVTEFAAPSMSAPHEFTPVTEGEVPAAFEVVRRWPVAGQRRRLMDLGWQWALASAGRVAEAAAARRAYWWRGRSGALTLGDDEDEGRAHSFVSLIAAPPDGMAALLRDFRALAADRGRELAVWRVPVLPGPVEALRAAGFERQWDDALFHFEARHD